MKRKHKKFIEEIGHCEMCGDNRNLQLHHIIPQTCENGYINLDVKDNWLCVCSICHAKLTPKNLLTKYGIRKTIAKNELLEIPIIFYSRCQRIIDEENELQVADVFDVFDKTMIEMGITNENT